MELESSYHLLGVVRDDGIRTYQATDIASGQELQVHLFARPDSEEDRALFKAIRALPVSKRRELLEIGMEGDLPYVATEKLPEGSTAREWLSKFAGVVSKPSDPVFLAGAWKTGTPIPDELLKASHPSALPAPPPPKKQPELSPDYTRVMRIPETPVNAEPIPAAEPDEFSRLFGETAAPPVTPQAAPTPPPAKEEPGEFTRMFLAARPPESAPPVAAPQQEGEFTRQFRAAGVPLPQQKPDSSAEQVSLASRAPVDQPADLHQTVQPAAPPPSLQADPPPAVQPPPVPPSSEEPTRLFQAVMPSSPPPARSSSALPPVTSSEPPVKEGPSEFTRFFQSPIHPTPATGNRLASSVPAPPQQPISRPSAQPGEFTQMFGNPNKPVSNPPLPLGSGSSGSSSSASSATGLFAVPQSSQPQAPMAASGIGYSGGKSGPGEFTRMMSASTPPTLGQPLPPAKSAEPKPTSNLLLYIAGGAVLLAIILIIIFLLMRH